MLALKVRLKSELEIGRNIFNKNTTIKELNSFSKRHEPIFLTNKSAEMLITVGTQVYTLIKLIK